MTHLKSARNPISTERFLRIYLENKRIFANGVVYEIFQSEKLQVQDFQEKKDLHEDFRDFSKPGKDFDKSLRDF